MENLRDLTLLVLSRHPMICVRSYEEERVMRLVERTAAGRAVPADAPPVPARPEPVPVL
ncbi:MAG: hypothetical protein V3U98_06865 [Acidobacteriota bacterium]